MIDKKKKIVLLSIIGLVGLVVITIGVTYAFFNYTREGTRENSVQAGAITFLYTEIDKIGAGIQLTDAFPITDEIGKKQTGVGKVFNFKVTATTKINADIPYEVTVRKKNNSTLKEDAIKIYLTEVNGTNETELLLEHFSNLDQTDMMDENQYIEKTIYADIVPKNSSTYEKNFRLRMWISDDVDFSTEEYQAKTFTITVNVYSNSSMLNNIYAKNLKYQGVDTNCKDAECALNEIYERIEKRSR